MTIKIQHYTNTASATPFEWTGRMKPAHKKERKKERKKRKKKRKKKTLTNRKIASIFDHCTIGSESIIDLTTPDRKLNRNIIWIHTNTNTHTLYIYI